VLRKAIRQVEFAAASDDTRPVLTGVHALIEGDRLTFAASDGFRLSVKYVPLSTPISERLEMVIPAAALRELARLVAEEDEPIEFIANPARGEVRFHLKNLQMMSKLIQGTFPDYSRFIPKSYATRVVVSATDLRQAIRSTAVFARDGAGIVRLQVTPGGELGPGRLTISARAEEAGENVVELDVAVEGQEAKIAFNNKYLQDVLNEIDAEQVAIQTETPSSPGVFVPTGRDDYTHVVMPMFVQW
ncbi:MAG TPA: DNA polymerase III subunit beta, partial [Gemmatimonadales bacterium]|nr:DNA polymerase III subunit beta [Gemmatimonadales bacterium]